MELDSIKLNRIKSIIANWKTISENPIGHQSIIQSQGLFQQVGCCGFLWTQKDPFEVILRKRDIKLSEEIQDRWIKEISMLFPIKLEDNTELFNSTPRSYSDLTALKSINIDETIITIIVKSLVDILQSRFQDIERELKKILISLIELKNTIIKTGVVIKILSKKECIEYINSLKIIEDFSFITLSYFTKFLLDFLKKYKLEHTESLNFAKFLGVWGTGLLFDTAGSIKNGHMLYKTSILSSPMSSISEEYLFIDSSTCKTYETDLKRYGKRGMCYNTFPLVLENNITPLLKIMEEVIEEVLKIAEKDLERLEFTPKKVLKVSSSKFNNLQCHTVIRPLWENPDWITNYFKLRDNFPTIDPYLLFNLTGIYFQHSTYGNIHDGKATIYFVDEKPIKDIISLKYKNFKSVRTNGVVNTFSDIMYKGATHCIPDKNLPIFDSEIENVIRTIDTIKEEI